MPKLGLTLTFRRQMEAKAGMVTLCNKLLRHKHRFKYIFFPEFGENGRFHFHGVIDVTNENMPFYASFIGNWQRHEGFFKQTRHLKSLKQIIGTFLYARKDLWKMLKFFNEKDPTRVFINNNTRNEIKNINLSKVISGKTGQKTILDYFILGDRKGRSPFVASAKTKSAPETPNIMA